MPDVAPNHAVARPAPSWPRSFIWAGVFGVAALIANFVGHLLHYAPDNVATFWPANGLLLGALLLTPWSRWLLLVAVMFIAQVIGDTTVANFPEFFQTDAKGWYFSAGVVNCIEGVVAALLLMPIIGRGTKRNLIVTVLALIGLGSVVAAGLAASLGALAVVMSSPDASFFDVWQVWWLADGLGILIVTPLMLAWTHCGPLRDERWTIARLIETGLIFGSLAITAHLVFSSHSQQQRDFFEFPYMVLPFLIWAALRFGPRIVTTTLLIGSVILVLYADQGLGPFVLVGADAQSNVLAMQMFLVATTVSVLLLNATAYEHRLADKAMKREMELRTIFEQRQQLLMSELDHRVKNNLASVLSLIPITRQSAGQSIDSFTSAFSGRVQALAQTHDVLATQYWHGGDLEDLLERVLAPFVAPGTSKLVLDGPAVSLPPRLCGPLALAIHELGSNALRHGSLRDQDGTITITWQVSDGGIKLQWREHDGMAVHETLRPGAGLNLVRGLIEHEMGGRFDYHLPEAGFEATISFEIEPDHAELGPLPPFNTTLANGQP